MQVKATVLVENAVYGQPDAIAEHGWSVWLETPAGNFLFDTGQGKALPNNAAHYRKDLSTTQAVLISHHHFDHTGGLVYALTAMGGGPVYAHPDLFKASYRQARDEEPRPIGMPHTRSALEAAGADFRWTRTWTQVAEGIYMTGEVPRRTGFEVGDPHLKHRDATGSLVVDPIIDDQTVVVETDRGLLVVLGCSHAGVVNILYYVIERTGVARIHTVIGGTHLGPAGEEQLSRTVEALLALDIQRIGVSHCTGHLASMRLAQAFGDRFFFCNVGTEVEV